MATSKGRSPLAACRCNRSARLQAVRCRAGRFDQARRRGRDRRSRSRAAGPSSATSTSWPTRGVRRAVMAARSVLSSTTSTRCGVTPAGIRCGRGRDGRPRHRPSLDHAGRRMANSLPRRSVAVGLDRAAVHLDQALDQRQADAQPALRPVQRRSTWVNRSKTRGSISGGMPMPVSRTRDDRVVALRARPISADLARRSVYLAALLSRLATTCASRVGSASHERAGSAAASTSARGCAPSISGRLVSTALATTVARSTGSVRSSILPRVIRDTSSRSSTSRTSAAPAGRSMSRRSSRSSDRRRPSAG